MSARTATGTRMTIYSKTSKSAVTPITQPEPDPDARAFTAGIRQELEYELLLLNETIPRNDKVRLLWRGETRISITPFKPLPEPKGLEAIKGEIGQRWPMTGLLDVLKEAALDTGLLEAFETSASRVALSREALDRRLLLCLYGLGTNAGLKRVAGATPDVSYDELLHVHRRFIHAPALREACARVANATLAIRNAAVWETPARHARPIPRSSARGIAIS